MRITLEIQILALLLIVSLVEFSAGQDAQSRQLIESEGTCVGCPLDDDIVVKLRVSVTNQKGKVITDLRPENFSLFVNGQETEILSVTRDPGLLSVVLLFDISTSMTNTSLRRGQINRILWNQQSAVDFVNQSNPKNEYKLMSFGERVVEHTPFVDSQTISKTISDDSTLNFKKKANTSLNDALVSAAHKLSESHNPNKVVLLFSDAMENSSSYSSDEVSQLLADEGIEVWLIVAVDPTFPYLGMLSSRIVKLVEASGGFSFFCHSLDDSLLAAKGAADWLNNRYLISFSEKSIALRPKKNSKAEVKLKLNKEERKGFGRTTIRHRRQIALVSPNSAKVK